MKGFRSPEEARAHLAEVADLRFRTLFLSDYGHDIGVYLTVAERLRRSRYCFTNAYSVPLVDGWLAMLNSALEEPRAGLVGATGSWISTPSWTAFSLGLPSAYRGVLPPPPIVRQQLLKLKAEQEARGRRSWREALVERATTLRLLLAHERFPAYHVRTNVFMITHAVLERLRVSTGPRKVDTLMVEGGRQALTRKVLQLGMRALVVDRRGTVFDHEQWDRSLTFHQGEQEGLLVADNRTITYARGDTELRRVLSGLSWGSHARPTLHSSSGASVPI